MRLAGELWQSLDSVVRSMRELCGISKQNSFNMVGALLHCLLQDKTTLLVQDLVPSRIEMPTFCSNCIWKNHHICWNTIIGKTPSQMADSDFRNTYMITGFCRVDITTNPVFFSIENTINNAYNFSLEVERVIVAGFLKVVMDLYLTMLPFTARGNMMDWMTSFGRILEYLCCFFLLGWQSLILLNLLCGDNWFAG